MCNLSCLYWTILFVCGGFIGVTFIVGELFDFGEDVGHAIENIGDSFGDAFGNISDVFEGIFGGADTAEVDTNGFEMPEIGDIDHEISPTGPSPFSLRTICMFGVGFGAGGLIGTGLNWSPPLTLIPATGGGSFCAVVMFLFLRFLYGEQGTTSIQPKDYVGLIGRVTVSLPERKPGQVALVVKGQRMNVPARAENFQPIPSQTEVEVISMEGGTAIVKEIKR
ncbi:MAG: NfeD family protein [Candidatus Marinimicrobia bacterium]|nr:NfeD family protein [Candidatus Neomarinimicrobiota bacterium]